MKSKSITHPLAEQVRKACAKVCRDRAQALADNERNGYLDSDTNAFIWTNKEAEWTAIELEEAADAIDALDLSAHAVPTLSLANNGDPTRCQACGKSFYDEPTINLSQFNAVPQGGEFPQAKSSHSPEREGSGPAGTAPAPAAELPEEPEYPSDECSKDVWIQRLERWAMEMQSHALDLRAAFLAQRERADNAEANYRFMVERAANEKLDGYRELGARAAAAEERAEKAEQENGRLRKERAAILNIKSTDGLTSSEWILRTSLAESREAKMREELETVRAESDAKQAEIDRLMLEFCPNEMTPEQVETWAKSQRALPPNTIIEIDENGKVSLAPAIAAARKEKP